MFMAKNQLAEIMIERQKYPVFIQCGSQDHGVGFACQFLSGMNNIIPLGD